MTSPRRSRIPSPRSGGPQQRWLSGEEDDLFLVRLPGWIQLQTGGGFTLQRVLCQRKQRVSLSFSRSRTCGLDASGAYESCKKLLTLAAEIRTYDKRAIPGRRHVMCCASCIRGHTVKTLDGSHETSHSLQRRMASQIPVGEVRLARCCSRRNV